MLMLKNNKDLMTKLEIEITEAIEKIRDDFKANEDNYGTQVESYYGIAAAEVARKYFEDPGFIKEIKVTRKNTEEEIREAEWVNYWVDSPHKDVVFLSLLHCVPSYIQEAVDEERLRLKVGNSDEVLKEDIKEDHVKAVKWDTVVREMKRLHRDREDYAIIGQRMETLFKYL